MKLKEQFKISWPFLIAAVIFIVLVTLSTSGIYDVNDFLFAIIYLLLAGTFSYACIMAGKELYKNRKYGRIVLIVYGAGLLSGLFVYEAIDLLF
ncbi:MAG: hypothetical protein VB024_06170 [Dysgonamonadaceae bacterium]|jgi:hypothetical protein|nr:hypothetical protein [Dysgonamonadaceae bacterium]MEA5081195.1 hypothetical protein [Dysgonamonadaceae bacterium]